jgi:murein L,D-transpeptidase YcbB/YkuD
LYDTFYEQIIEKPAGKVWKKGRGASERVDPQTGDIYCLVDQPAVYKTVERKELKRPAGTRTEQIPAEYSTRTVRKLVTPPQQVRTPVPAELGTTTKKTMAKGDSCEYVQVLCQDNATQSKILEVEKALQARGQKVDNDGLDDEDLADALRGFQKEQGLPVTGLMTAGTLTALGVALEPMQQPPAATSTQ